MTFFHMVNKRLRGEPTELCDGNYHQNKTILSWSNGMTSLNRKYNGFPLKDHFINKVNDPKTIEIHRN